MPGREGAQRGAPAGGHEPAFRSGAGRGGLEGSRAPQGAPRSHTGRPASPHPPGAPSAPRWAAPGRAPPCGGCRAAGTPGRAQPDAKPVPARGLAAGRPPAGRAAPTAPPEQPGPAPGHGRGRAGETTRRPRARAASHGPWHRRFQGSGIQHTPRPPAGSPAARLLRKEEPLAGLDPPPPPQGRAVRLPCPARPPQATGARAALAGAPANPQVTRPSGGAGQAPGRSHRAR
ncbi:basic salivary proline-rich protein 1-like [Talpa occidentalis]|uniref:basic salivary proline-rich protein 1-like n=1 Tax=Talpa occidentalis TaxID=50954 RepID=UPI0018903646|nr:basic salivary proline-rich protein 1-like [Talpa occidentalis]